MTKAVLTAKISSDYDDRIEERYHFPRMYLRQVQQAVGDFVIYYEPRRNNGRQVYFATARVTHVEADPIKPDHFYAFISDFLPFSNPLPYRLGDHFWEARLRAEGGGVHPGNFQRAVRNLPDEEFANIFRAGFAATLTPDQSVVDHSLREETRPIVRPIHEYLVARPFRERAFGLRVRDIYDSTCAFTGLRLINGGGRTEIEAAHIRPVAGGHGGSDSVRNGIALSRTVHWMFDRGLISIDDNGRILRADRHLPEGATRLFNADGFVLPPMSGAERPHPAFLRYHRETIFKG